MSISTNLFAQKEDFIWRVGQKGGINFNNGQADTFTFNKHTYDDYTNASICDSSGKFLFYTNGVRIFNKNSDLMLNGDSLNPTPYSLYWYFGGQGALPIAGADIIIRRPNYSEQYYLFHQTYVNDWINMYCTTLYLTVVDMTLDSGRGGVTNIKNYHLYENDTLLAGNLAAVHHANGRDWWLVSKKLLAPVFYKWLITPDTILGPYSQSNQVASFSYYDQSRLSTGQACFSPNGDKYAVMYVSKNFYIYDFDRCSGELKYDTSIYLNDGNQSGGGTGCAFSPSGRYVYAATFGNIWQFDLYASDILASQTLIGHFISGTYCKSGLGGEAVFIMMRLAPDNKIYVSVGNVCNFLHIIEYPDSAGIACNFIQQAFEVPLDAGDATSFPNIPDYKLGASSIECNSGIADLKGLKQNDIEVFPNPGKGGFTIIFKQPKKNCKIEVFNALGQNIYGEEVRTVTNNTVNLRLNVLSGIYFVKVSDNEGQCVKKLIVE